MKKRGFTLIELLAVIVILAIIALIAIPTITNIVEEARKGAAESSALGYIDAVEKQIMIKKLKNINNIKDGEYDDVVEFNDDNNISVNGKLPTAGEIIIDKGKVTNARICIGGYEVEFNGTKATSTNTKCSTKIQPKPCKAYASNEIIFENGTPSEYTFTPKCNGNYKLEVWGAQGGSYSDSYHGGYGGYSVGEITLNKDTDLYIYIGGHPNNNSKVNTITNGGLNGGGTAYARKDLATNAGGGATHMALSTGLLSELSTKHDKILIVAGGGGGASTYSESRTGLGGSGGGLIGESGSYSTAGNCESYGLGGMQNQGGSYYISSGHFNQQSITISTSGFGYGGSSDSTNGGNGGGGGYYGGGGSSCIGGAGGGSGYIANPNLTNKKMVMYGTDNKYVSNDTQTKTEITTNVSETATSNYAKKGNGYAKITYLGN